MPYSAFGTLRLAAASVEQGGVLRAPLGTIVLGGGFSVTLGLDNEVLGPADLLSGNFDLSAADDFAGFVRMIDALGGVWFNIPERIDDDSAQLYIDAGCWKLWQYEVRPA